MPPCEVRAIVPPPEGSFSVEPVSPLISQRSAQKSEGAGSEGTREREVIEA